MRRHNETEHQPDRTNEITSGILHLIGVGLAIAVLVVLIVVGARYGNVWNVVGYTLYGCGLILLYFASAAYHLIPNHKPRAKHIFKRLDHAFIYVLIAATYTPITFLALAGGWRWSMFGIIWGLALIGFITKILWLRIPHFLGTALYVAMGWLIVIAFGPLLESVGTATLWLLISGGLAYTVGVVCFALNSVLRPRKYFWMHEFFHVFVLAGSTLHTIVMFFLLQS